MKVLEATPMPLIIENNWLQKLKARIDFTLTNMSVKYRKKLSEMPILIEKESNPQQLLSKQSTYHYCSKMRKALKKIQFKSFFIKKMDSVQ